MHFSNKKCFHPSPPTSPPACWCKNTWSPRLVFVSHKPFTSMSWLSSNINSWQIWKQFWRYFFVAKVTGWCLDFIFKKVMVDHSSFGWNRIMVVVFFFVASPHWMLDQETHWCSKNLRRNHRHQKKTCQNARGHYITNPNFMHYQGEIAEITLHVHQVWSPKIIVQTTTKLAFEIFDAINLQNKSNIFW